jgi:hypothetical protein
MKRRWFQIHLSTAIVMMFVAGFFVMFDVALVEHFYSEMPTLNPEAYGILGVVIPIQLLAIIASADGCEDHIRRRATRKP